MPSEVVTQVHHLVRQSKAKKSLTFTNTRGEDLFVLYAAIEHDEDDVNPAHAHGELAGVDEEEQYNASNKDYDPEQSNGEDSEDKEDDNSNNNDNDGDDTPEIEILDNDARTATNTQHGMLSTKHWYELTKEERTKVLKYLMYLKEKR